MKNKSATTTTTKTTATTATSTTAAILTLTPDSRWNCCSADRLHFAARDSDRRWLDWSSFWGDEQRGHCANLPAGQLQNCGSSWKVRARGQSSSQKSHSCCHHSLVHTCQIETKVYVKTMLTRRRIISICMIIIVVVFVILRYFSSYYAAPLREHYGGDSALVQSRLWLVASPSIVWRLGLDPALYRTFPLVRNFSSSLGGLCKTGRLERERCLWMHSWGTPWLWK